jgi:hypothetical protein
MTEGKGESSKEQSNCYVSNTALISMDTNNKNNMFKNSVRIERPSTTIGMRI